MEAAKQRLRIALTLGDPGGVGPIVGLRALADLDPQLPVCVRCLAPATLRAALARLAGVELCRLEALEARGQLVWGGPSFGEDALLSSGPSVSGARFQYEALREATALLAEGAADALLTGPVSKSLISAHCVPFRGQTEFLAETAGLAPDAVTMLFLGERQRFALVTTHLPLSAVAMELSEARVRRSARHLEAAILALDGQEQRPMALAALNPHAGEGGLLGLEESRLLEPARAAFNAEQGRRLRLRGPIAAETLFREASAGAYAGVVCLYHDQATVPLKLLAWQDAVNTTWGLPYLRTSVDHGVGYAARQNGTVDAAGMHSALRRLLRLRALA